MTMNIQKYPIKASKKMLGRITPDIPEEYSTREAIAAYGVVGIFMIWFLVPVGWTLFSTFKSQEIILADRFILIPSLNNLTLDNYITVLSTPLFQRLFINSVFIAICVTGLTLLFGLLGGYSLSRFSYPGRQTILLSLLSSKMIPFVLVLIPFFMMMWLLNLVDTYIGIILAHSVSALPLGLWLMKGYIDDIPISFEEAARIDGCSRLQVIRHIVVPMSLPGIAVTGFYAFIRSWNDFLFVSILSQSTSTRTLPYGLYIFRGTQTINWGNTITAAMITMIPTIVIFAFVQQRIVEGLASGGRHGI
ncbi:MAG: carbohydrate ABC transporter permease [Halobacteriaceae archaeon]